MIISAIVAATNNNVIGNNGLMPWKLKDDLKSFKKLTLGHHLIVGRKTFQSIGKPLPGRKMLVLSRDADLDIPGVKVFSKLDEAIFFAKSNDETELFIGGGAEIYQLALPHLDRIYFTRINTEMDGDTFWPLNNWGEWNLTSQINFAANERNQFEFNIEIWDKNQAN